MYSYFYFSFVKRRPLNGEYQRSAWDSVYLLSSHKTELQCKQLNYSTFIIFFFPQCKHVLAIKLAKAMDLSKSQQVTDLEMTNLIKNLE